MQNSLIIFLASILLWIMIAGIFLSFFTNGMMKKELFLHALFAAGVSLMAGFILKEIFRIPRPFMVDGLPPVTLFTLHDWSFPSEHAAIAFSIATTIWLHDKRIGSVYVVGAILVAVGRVFGNVHYPLDIFGGALLGIAVALTVVNFHLSKIIKRQIP